MKKVFLFLFLASGITTLHAQGFKGLLKKVKSDSSVSKIISQKPSNGLGSDEIINGLKEALTVGTNNGTKKLSMVDGFFKDAAIKILMPAEAQKVEQKLRAIGMGK